MAADHAVEAARAALSLPYRYDVGDMDMRRALAAAYEAEAEYMLITERGPGGVPNEVCRCSDRLYKRAAALRAGA